MTQLNCMVATPPGFLSGTWELTPFQPYAVGSTTVTGPFRGDITVGGLLAVKGGTTAAQVSVPAPNGGYDAGLGVLTTNFKTATATLPGRPMTVPLVETSAGVMDVAYLLSVGRAQVLTPQQAVDFQTLMAQGYTARDAALAAADLVNAALAQVSQALADSAQTRDRLLRSAGLMPWTGGDHTTLPVPAGDYLIMRGPETGQAWTRTAAGAAPSRNIGLESTPLLYGTRAQRLALVISTPAQWVETDGGITLTYIPGTGWRGPYGDNIDNPPPPDDGRLP